MGNLFLALLITLLCTLFAYASQVFFAASVDARSRTYEHPYSGETEKSEKQKLYGNITRVLAIVMAILAGVCLFVAGYSFLSLT